MTVGKGKPSAWQCSATECPATTLVSLGSITHSGGTEKYKDIMSDFT